MAISSFFKNNEAMLTWCFRIAIGALLVAQLYLQSTFVTRAEFTKAMDEQEGSIREAVNQMTRYVLKDDFKVYLDERKDLPLRVQSLEKFERDYDRRLPIEQQALISLGDKVGNLQVQASVTQRLLEETSRQVTGFGVKLDTSLASLASRP